MPHQTLDRDHIDPRPQGVRGEAMAQAVDGGGLFQMDGFTCDAERLLERGWMERSRIDERSPFEEVVGRAVTQPVPPELITEGGREQDVSAVSSLLELDANQGFVAANIGDSQGNGFAEPHAGGIQQGKDQAVAVVAHRCEQGLHLIDAQSTGWTQGTSLGSQAFELEALLPEFEPTYDGNELDIVPRCRETEAIALVNEMVIGVLAGEAFPRDPSESNHAQDARDVAFLSGWRHAAGMEMAVEGLDEGIGHGRSPRW